MVDKLIRGKIIEIIFVVIFVIISIPVWQTVQKRVSAANVTTLDDYNVNFDIYNTNNLDRIVITNEYYINKNYKIYLVINKNTDEDNSSILINNTEYKLNEFYKEKDRNNYVYTLVNDYISADIILYDIEPKIVGNSDNYTYIFEEKTIF